MNVDTIRYSVPHSYVGEYVDVKVGEAEVEIFGGDKQIASHRRSRDPHGTIKDPSHYDGLIRSPSKDLGKKSSVGHPGQGADKSLADMGRSLSDYADVMGETA